MIKTGLVSITFRKLDVQEVVELVAKEGLQGIEWGGDIHVPHGNLKKAARVKEMMKDAGLFTAAYGSYYKTGCINDFSFEEVLNTAMELEAPVIRIWAGDKGSLEAGDYFQKAVVDDAVEICRMALEHGVDIAFEYHVNTLADTADSALKLVKEINLPNIKLYWQPAVNLSLEQRMESLERVLPYLSNIHVFNWKGYDRYPLEDGYDEWKDYFNLIRNAGRSPFAMLEFVKDDLPEQFLMDAKVLKQL